MQRISIIALIFKTNNQKHVVKLKHNTRVILNMYSRNVGLTGTRNVKRIINLNQIPLMTLTSQSLQSNCNGLNT